MKTKANVIECLKVTPIVQVACKKAGISRATYYRWRDEDKKFKKESEEALKNGYLFINDVAESQLLSLIKKENMTAIIFWLKHHHKDYSENRLYLSVPDQKFLAKNINSGDKSKVCKLLTKEAVEGKISTSNAKNLISTVNKTPEEPLVSMLSNTNNIVKLIRGLED